MGDTLGRDVSEVALTAYNSMYGYIYRYLLREIGPQADATLHTAVKDLHVAGGLLTACTVTRGGILDAAPLMIAVAALPEADRALELTNVLNEVLYAMLFAVRKTIGADHEAHILRALRPDSMLLEV